MTVIDSSIAIVSSPMTLADRSMVMAAARLSKIFALLGGTEKVKHHSG
jgi:hypothetical protein